MTKILLIAKLFTACIIAKNIFIDYNMRFKWITADFLSINMYHRIYMRTEGERSSYLRTCRKNKYTNWLTTGMVSTHLRSIIVYLFFFCAHAVDVYYIGICYLQNIWSIFFIYFISFSKTYRRLIIRIIIELREYWFN